MPEIIKFIIYGLIQGLAEVLPISSSAHLVILGNIMGDIDEGLTFEIFLHLASLIGILVFLWPKLWRLIKGFCLYVFKKNKDYKLEFKYCLFIIVSTIPTVIFTLIFGDIVDYVSGTLWLVGLLLIINGLLLLFLTRIKGERKEEDLNIKDAIIIGCFQCAGIFPGISRSGSCICGAYSRKIEKNTAADYAFLMFIPAVVGATVLELANFNSASLVTSMIPLYICSFIVAGITTYFAFNILLKTIRKGKLTWFSFYCFIVGTAAFIFGLIK